MINQVTLSNLIQVEKDLKGILVGNRIPRDYFVTKGTGQSDITVHAGSYHLALKDANIEMCNIMTYSSILPGIAQKIERPHHLEHGSVMESIMSVCTAEKGQQASAGIIYGWLHDKKTHEKYGGLVCEHFGHYDEHELTVNLKASLNELYVNGFDGQYHLQNIELITQSFVPEKKYGTALVALCFTNYVYPVIAA
jgi:arginine decarboxylase